MKIAPYVEKLHNSEQYKKFIKQYPDAALVAGFFVIDLEAGNNIHQIDYYVPSQKKIAAFTLDGQVSVQLLSLINKKVPESLDIKTKTDLDSLKGIIEEEMRNRNMTEEINKIIAIIQNIDKRKVWSLNCVLSGMHILKASVEDESQTVLKMDKSSIFDFIQKMSGKELAKMQQQAKAQMPSIQQESESKDSSPKLSKEQMKSEIDKLNKLEEQIESEKQNLKKKIDEKS